MQSDQTISCQKNPPESKVLLPGGTIGILGGGQLGKMLAIEAKKLGYRVGILDPEKGCPAAQVSDFSVVADYSDLAAVAALADASDVLTFEFENVRSAPLKEVAVSRCRICPDPEVLHIAQNREREKNFLAANGFPCAPFAVVSSAEELEKAAEVIGFPCVLKTADFGYDGKGQCRLEKGFDAREVWHRFSCPKGVLEGWVPFSAELSAVCARWESGETRCLPVSENQHRHHILDASIVPASIPSEIQDQARSIAASIAEKLQVVGLLAVEFFLHCDGTLLVNELAPRPHNSGHYSFDACICGQFEQHIRAICGLPPGSTELLSPVVMVNLLGDLWPEGGTPPWEKILVNPALKLHLYGKSSPRNGRKMGHFCTLAPTVSQAVADANFARETLGLPPIQRG